MKRISFFILAMALILFSQTGCVASNSEKEREELLFVANIVQLLETPYKEVTPEAGSIRIDGRVNKTINFNPSCTGVPRNETFKFYTKKGRSKDLVINFMGGGACWDDKNCLGEFTPTYFNQAARFSPLAGRYAFDGIMNERVPLNPFRD